jgi:hypothetical protein
MMLKNLMAGLLIGGTATVAIAGLTSHVVNAQADDVVNLCPQQPEWAQGVPFYEYLSHGDSQKSAWIVSEYAVVKDGPGMSKGELGRLPQNTKVLVTGEAWDNGCNRWMKVEDEYGSAWIHGSDLAYAPSNTIGPVDELPPPEPKSEEPFIQDVCPNAQDADWTEGYTLYETIPHSSATSKQIISNDGANLRSGSGMSHEVLKAFPRGTTVTISGEKWDRGCKQWMQVEVDGMSGWMDGYTLQ